MSQNFSIRKLKNGVQGVLLGAVLLSPTVLETVTVLAEDAQNKQVQVDSKKEITKDSSKVQQTLKNATNLKDAQKESKLEQESVTNLLMLSKTSADLNAVVESFKAAGLTVNELGAKEFANEAEAQAYLDAKKSELDSVLAKYQGDVVAYNQAKTLYDAFVANLKQYEADHEAWVKEKASIEKSNADVDVRMKAYEAEVVRVNAENKAKEDEYAKKSETVKKENEALKSDYQVKVAAYEKEVARVNAANAEKDKQAAAAGASNQAAIDAVKAENAEIEKRNAVKMADYEKKLAKYKADSANAGQKKPLLDSNSLAELVGTLSGTGRDFYQDIAVSYTGNDEVETATLGIYPDKTRIADIHITGGEGNYIFTDDSEGRYKISIKNAKSGDGFTYKNVGTTNMGKNVNLKITILSDVTDGLIFGVPDSKDDADSNTLGVSSGATSKVKYDFVDDNNKPIKLVFGTIISDIDNDETSEFVFNNNGGSTYIPAASDLTKSGNVISSSGAKTEGLTSSPTGTYVAYGASDGFTYTHGRTLYYYGILGSAGEVRIIPKEPVKPKLEELKSVPTATATTVTHEKLPMAPVEPTYTSLPEKPTATALPNKPTGSKQVVPNEPVRPTDVAEPQVVVKPTVDVAAPIYKLPFGVVQKVDEGLVAKDGVVSLSYDFTVLPSNRKDVTTFVVNAYIPDGVIYDLEAIKSENSLFDVTEGDHALTFILKDVSSVNGDKSKESMLPSITYKVTTQNDNGHYPFGASAVLNDGEDHKVMTNVSTLVTAGDSASLIEPKIALATDVTHALLTTTLEFKATWDLDQYKDIKPATNSYGYVFRYDPKQATVAVDNVADFDVKTYASLAEAPKDLQEQFKKSGVVVDAGFIYVTPKDPEKFFKEFVQAGKSVDLVVKATPIRGAKSVDVSGLQFDFGNGYEANDIEIPVKYETTFTDGKTSILDKVLGDELASKDLVKDSKYKFVETKDTPTGVEHVFELKRSNVIVKYVDENGETLKPQETVLENVEVGTKYDTSSKKLEKITVDGDDYEFVKVDGSETGDVVESDTVVTYVYKKAVKEKTYPKQETPKQTSNPLPQTGEMVATSSVLGLLVGVLGLSGLMYIVRRRNSK